MTGIAGSGSWNRDCVAFGTLASGLATVVAKQKWQTRRLQCGAIRVELRHGKEGNARAAGGRDEGEDGGEAAMDEGGRDTRRRRLWRMALPLDAVAEAVAWRHASAKDVGMDEALQARQEGATTARTEAK